MKTQRTGTGGGLSTYRHDLLAAMSGVLLAPLFSAWTVAGGVRWTPRLLTWAAVLMVWEPGATLGARFTQTYTALVALFPGHRRPGRSYQGFVQALIAWSPRLLGVLEPHLRTLVRAAAGAAWEVGGWVLIAVDGSRVALPHTAANLRAFGCGGKKHSGPSAWLVMLLHLGTNLPWAWKLGRASADERGLLRQMLGLLPDNALVIADAGYTGYAFWQGLQDTGRSFLIRVGSNVRLLTQLGYAVREYDGLVYVWPDRAQKRRQPPLILRLIVLSDGRKPVYLVTNVLDPTRLSVAQAAEFYRRRWHIELFFRGLKQTLAKRTMRSAAPVQAALELRWAVLGLALLGLWGVQALAAAGADVRRLSLAAALRHLRACLADPARRCPRRLRLAVRLAGARQDAYRRKGPKVSGHWPHKKHERPPGAPKIQPATTEQVLAAQALSSLRTAA